MLVMAGTLLADLFWLKRRGLAAGRLIHDKMLKSVYWVRKFAFLIRHPVGRTLQRFSRDLRIRGYSFAMVV
jgi:hypothetical protein